MIDRLRIKNIQSHKNSELEFSPGINVIIGSSNNGKSAILRALYWAVYNRPLGIETLCSHWAINDKGKQTEEMSVEVEKNNSVLVRRKTKSNNEYVVGGEVLEAIRTDVPKQVTDFFMLTETNIQSQQDSPFLLSLSNGDVAKYFNRIANLDVIDKILGTAESKRRELKREIETNDRLISDYEKKHEKYSWVKTAEKKFSEYERLLVSKEKVELSFNEINSEIENYRVIEKRILNFKKVLKNKKIILKFEKSVDEETQWKKKFDELNSTISEYKFILSSVEKISAVEKFKVLVEKIRKLLNDVYELKEKISSIKSELLVYHENEKFSKLNFTKELNLINKIQNNSIDDIQNDFENLDSRIENYKLMLGRVKECDEKIILLRKQLPEVCPLCGAKMKKGRCENEE